MPCRGHLLAIPLTETDFCTACRHSLPKRATECFAFDAKLAMVLCAILLSACGVLGTSDVKFQPERSGTSRDSETRSEFIQRLRNALRDGNRFTGLSPELGKGSKLLFEAWLQVVTFSLAVPCLLPEAT
jgi:hypothetical protein